MSATTHRVTWLAAGWDGSGNKFWQPRAKWMKVREGWNSYEAECSCGWKTRTGGATAAYIERQIRRHKIEESE